MKDDDGKSLKCRAHGCPLNWAVQTGEVTACSYHAWDPFEKWPAITDELLRIGPWKLTHKAESPTVRDMKTRLRHGQKFDAPEPQL